MKSFTELRINYFSKYLKYMQSVLMLQNVSVKTITGAGPKETLNQEGILGKR